jgi:hypothetical protein
MPALRELRDHNRVNGLIVNLRANLGTRRRSRDRGLFVAPRRIGIDGAEKSQMRV